MFNPLSFCKFFLFASDDCGEVLSLQKVTRGINIKKVKVYICTHAVAVL